MNACAELTHPDPGRPGLRWTTVSILGGKEERDKICY